MNRRPRFWRAALTVAWKDLLTEWRSREAFSAMLVFALLVIFIFNFALELKPAARAEISAGILWVTLCFAGALGLNRAWVSEKDRGCLDGLLLAPVDRAALYFGKLFSGWLILMLIAAVLLPVYGLLYNQNLILPGLLLFIALGIEGYLAVGTLLAAMAVQARSRDLLLPVLLFPVTLPALIAAVKASSALLSGLPWIDVQPWLMLLLAFDLIFTVVAWLAFDIVMEE